MDERDTSLIAPEINTSPGPEYAAKRRLWQGIPGVERAKNGRLWAVWYSGGSGEGPENYVVLATSADDGATWSEPVLVIDPPGKVRAFDPCLWHDPTGRLWLFWAQSYELFDGRAGVWCVRCDDSDGERPAWSAPRRIANGVMMNKPTVLSTGEWLLPTAVWASKEPYRPDMAAERFSNALCTEDGGETFAIRGGADVPNIRYDEHMIVERGDGSLWMLVRLKRGVGEAVSTDRGRTWTASDRLRFRGPSTRFFIRRLRSGNLLLVNHEHDERRTDLTAYLSEDDGWTWPHRLLLDERDSVSYPDGVEDESGLVRVVYDRERKGAKEILAARFREQDIRRGAFVSSDARAKMLVNRAG